MDKAQQLLEGATAFGSPANKAKALA